MPKSRGRLTGRDDRTIGDAEVISGATVRSDDQSRSRCDLKSAKRETRQGEFWLERRFGEQLAVFYRPNRPTAAQANRFFVAPNPGSAVCQQPAATQLPVPAAASSCDGRELNFQWEPQSFRFWVGRVMRRPRLFRFVEQKALHPLHRAKAANAGREW